MSVIHCCDRCKEHSLNEGFTRVLKVPIGGDNGRTWDLCEDCLKELRSWILQGVAKAAPVKEIPQGTSETVSKL